MAGFELPCRFWNKVKRAGVNDCWEWTAYKSSDGYGRFLWKNRRVVNAHRLVFESQGFDVNALVIRHACDNPACVNPAHLIAGTHADNVKDRDIRGRGRWTGKKGSANSMAKLDEQSVIAIRRAHALLPRHPSGRVKPGELRNLSEKLRLPYGTLRNIVDCYQWKHILGEFN